MREVLFWGFAGMAIISAFLCVTRRSAVSSALWLVSTLFDLAAIYVLLDAQFIAAMQVLVYAGAIMVLFLFVIMLLNLGREGPGDLKGWGGRIVATALAVGLVVELWALKAALAGEGGFQAVTAAYPLPEGTVAGMAEAQGVVGLIADTLFRQYLVPFEITSVLLMAAVVGAVVLAKRKL
ncbi:MAG TPA: NADH-quinone oxidoreductase subunit J [Gemmatimonadales bacterium]